MSSPGHALPAPDRDARSSNRPPTTLCPTCAIYRSGPYRFPSMRKPRSHLRAGFSTTTMTPLFFWTVVAKEAVSGTGGRGRAETALTSALGHPVWTAALCEARETGRTETSRLFRLTPTDLGLSQGQTTRESEAETTPKPGARPSFSTIAP